MSLLVARSIAHMYPNLVVLPADPSRFLRGKNGGESGIRTHDRVSPIHAFQACAFSHSAISPRRGGLARFYRTQRATRRRGSRTRLDPISTCHPGTEATLTPA